MNRYGRFHRVWEFDRNPDASGTEEQQARVIAILGRHGAHGTGFDEALWMLDKAVNQAGRSYLWFTFLDDPLRNPWANATRVRIAFYEDPDDLSAEDLFEAHVLHEIGHVVAWNLFNPIDRTEAWAEEFRTWVMRGSVNDLTWKRLVDSGWHGPR